VCERAKRGHAERELDARCAWSPVRERIGTPYVKLDV